MKIVGPSARSLPRRVATANIERSCANANCAKSFIAKRKDHRYCSPQCRMVAAKLALLETRICANPDCGKPFQPKRDNQIHCTRDCQKNSSRAQDRKLNETEFIAVDGEGQTGPCHVCACSGPKHTDECASHEITRYWHGDSFQLKIHNCDHFTYDAANHPVCECGHSIFDHQHVYILLGVGNDQYENPNGFAWDEVFEILYSHYEQHPDAAFVGFFLGYDKSQWIRPPFPEDKAWRLLTKPGRQARTRVINGRKRTFPVDVQGQKRMWQVGMIPGRVITIRPKDCSCDSDYCEHYYDNGLMSICDVGGFFQKSFMKVIDPKEWKGVDITWTMTDFEEIKQGKDRRSNAVLDDEMRYYNRKENWLLQEVMKLLNALLVEIHVKLNKDQWFGAGQIAQQLLRNYNAPTREDIEQTIPRPILSRLTDGYFGGWFEVAVHGVIKGTVYEYDINSAYPSVIARLPCIGQYVSETHDEFIDVNLAQEKIRAGKSKSVHMSSDGRFYISKKRKVFEPHGEWTQSHPGMQMARLVPFSELSELKPNQYRLVHAHMKGSDPYLGAALHREWRSSTILTPHETSGWIWQGELEARRDAGLIDEIEVDEWVMFEKTCDCPPPLAGFGELYELRRDSKSEAKRMVYKLGYNSPYGKLVQSIGEPKYSNPFWGSLITSECRAQIARAIGSHPLGSGAVVKIATDAVYFLTPHDKLEINKELGKWGEDPHANLTIFKPGVDWDQETLEQIERGEEAHYRRRGASRDMTKYLKDINAMFSTADLANGEWPEIEFSVGFPLISNLQAVMRHQWNTAGQMQRSENNHVKQDSNPKTKRTGVYWDAENEIWRSRPYDYPQKSVRPEDRGNYARYLPTYESQPYDKRLGISVLTDESYGEGVVNPDGPQGMMIKEQLGWE